MKIASVEPVNGWEVDVGQSGKRCMEVLRRVSKRMRKTA
jgi:hypothetical protein